ncbi:putative folylpolyglutamate synthetase, mur-like, catalytic domain superfamily [Septoria linicola]|nr:putative folylpolyglutamate synthetase, mur-like, catalytic domain superfamily [Septoria linicola]
MIELGLQRISRLLSNTALPWRAIHVAGTNGKGTVCYLTSEMLEAYNRSHFRINRQQALIKHGRFTSPHLVDRWDCITFNNPETSAMKVVREDVFLEEERAVKEVDQKQKIQASEFELLTATAFSLFTQQALDVAVVEVGLGGRLDATNVIGESVSGSTETKLIRKRFNPAKWRPPPLITAITQIGLDHQGFLGNTKAEIAMQKAGIMKPRTPVTWTPDSELDTVFHERANHLDAPVLERRDLPFLNSQDRGSDARAINGELATISAWTALSGLGRVPDPQEAVQSGTDLQALVTDWQDIVQNHVFPGRQEFVSVEPVIGRPRTILLDGAHNEDGIRLLTNTVDSRLRAGSKPVIWLLALSQSTDRAPEKILKSLVHEGDRVMAVEFGPVDGMPWVTPRACGEIVEAVNTLHAGLDARAHGKDLKSAIVEACHLADEVQGEVVVCGSLYLAGDVHRLIRTSAS